MTDNSYLLLLSLCFFAVPLSVLGSLYTFSSYTLINFRNSSDNQHFGT
jgi:hypothetical protein